MDLEKIVLLSDPKKIGLVKEIVEALKEKIPKLKTAPFRYGKLGEDVVISFAVEKKYFLLVVEKLTYNNFQVITNDPEAKEIIDTARLKTGQLKPVSEGWEDIRLKPKLSAKKGIDDLIKEGDYRELIRISKDYTLAKEVTEKAKNNITAAVSNAIGNLYGEGLLRKFETEKCADKLIEIASDKVLKTMNLIDLLKQAGIYAVDLCTRNKKLTGELIYIANNNSVHNLVSVKAAVTFGDIVLSDPLTYDEELHMAVKDLNVRWLSIAVNVVWNDLDQKEKEKFDALVNYINQNRS